MIPFACYLSSTNEVLPVLPAGIVPLSTVYPDRSRNVLDSPWRPGLHAVGPDGYRKPSVYDETAVDELAAYLLRSGVREVQIDWEADATPENNAVLKQIVWRLWMWKLGGAGLRVSLYGVRDAFYTTLSGDIYPVWYPFTTDLDLWQRLRRAELLKLRRMFNGRRVIPELCSVHGQSGDGKPVPVGDYVGDDHMRGYLDVCRDADGVSLWPGMRKSDGNWIKPGDPTPGLAVFAEFAAKTAVENPK